MFNGSVEKESHLRVAFFIGFHRPRPWAHRAGARAGKGLHDGGASAAFQRESAEFDAGLQLCLRAGMVLLQAGFSMGQGPGLAGLERRLMPKLCTGWALCGEKRAGVIPPKA